MTTICFDLDGTLTDPKPGITRSIRHALIALTGAAPQEDELTWCIGPPLIGSLERLLAGRGDATVALAKYRERFSDVGLFENEVYPAIPETLAALTAAGHRLFVATSKPTIYARRIVEHFDLSRHFDDVLGAELDGRRSDKSELLSWLLTEKQIAPADAIMVGDRSHDMVGARANNMRAIGVLYGYGTEAELTEAGADALCRSPDALADVLAPLA